MRRLKKMLNQFVKNLKESEYYQNRKVQSGIILATIIITMIMILLPELRENILAIMVGIIIVGAPITILGIYDGIFKNKS